MYKLHDQPNKSESHPAGFVLKNAPKNSSWVDPTWPFNWQKSAKQQWIPSGGIRPEIAPKNSSWIFDGAHKLYLLKTSFCKPNSYELHTLVCLLMNYVLDATICIFLANIIPFTTKYTHCDAVNDVCQPSYVVRQSLCCLLGPVIKPLWCFQYMSCGNLK